MFHRRVAIRRKTLSLVIGAKIGARRVTRIPLFNILLIFKTINIIVYVYDTMLFSLKLNLLPIKLIRYRM